MSTATSVPIEVQGMTNQINNMLTKINDRSNTIEQLKESRKKYESAAVEFGNIQMKIKDLNSENKEERKLIETLVEYVRNNYGIDFDPGSLFNQEPEEELEEAEA